MSVLTEIINLLSNEKESVTSGLLKLKILASRVENMELLEWVARELDGYYDDTELPRYRVAPSVLKGTFWNSYSTYEDYDIPSIKLR